MNQKELIHKLKQDNTTLVEFAQNLKTLKIEDIQAKENEEWSIIDCIEHMNISMEVYLNQIMPRLATDLKPKNGQYKPGWLAAYFAKGMEPTAEGKIRNKMKTFKKLDPKQVSRNVNELERFIQNIETTIEITEKIKDKNLKSFKVKTALGSWLKFYLGDALWFYTAHNLRHMLQIQNMF
ncbi:DinB family protein [Fulvivirga maritima]|uniref:DinB family protein n=1 Tax=Fulvivirga maritima TaxID=2904247 RepID=UPI001F179C3F|nr:DinB family protein [Fulvivirga maritima]UII28191.1 DinB family protein [Fulvivirga maritima]